MALVKFGGGVAGISGSVGGVTFARNRSGSYMRQRTIPVNPNSARQNSVRDNMSAVVAEWSNTLTPAERDQWAVYAAAIVRTNRVGEQIFNTGFNWFTGNMTAILEAGLPLVPAGPATLSLPIPDATLTITALETAQALSVAFDDQMDWVDEDDAALVVFMGQPVNATRNFFNGPWRQAGIVLGDGTTAPTTPAAMVAPFQIQENQIVYFEARILRADGRISDRFRTPATVGA